MKFRNLATNEVVTVSNLKMQDERIFFTVRNKGCGSRFFNRNTCLILDEHVSNGTYLKCAEGWELFEEPKQRKPRQPKATKAQVHVEPTIVNEPTSEPVVSVEPQPQNEDDTTNEQALIAALKNLRGGAVDLAKVREIVAEELSKLIAKLIATDPKKAAKVIQVVKKNNSKKNEVYCAKFQRIVAKVSRGFHVYLYGPAGSGKSHTAEQVATALGLDFYGQTTIQFAHDVRGYGDAGGKFQDTPFYKAFAFGGLYFQDEYDRSNAEAAIVLNSALANGWYDFPIVGRVEAHPNFRFMAAGNTLMNGADDMYCTGQEIDTSSRDRLASFFHVDYSREVELRIAHGNTEIVDFVEDVRQAIKQTGIKHVVSYRATASMIDEIEHENDLVACCEESVFKGLEVDERAVIYGALKNKDNVWAQALKRLNNNK